MPYKLEDKDRNTLVIKQQYDANATLTNMSEISGTAFGLVIMKPLFWWLLCFHYLLWFLKEFHDCSEKLAVPKCQTTKEFFEKYPLFVGDIAMLSSLTTFFVVFYNSNCFTKFTTMYENVISIQGRLHNIGLYLRAYYCKSATRWTVIRYLLASHFIFYWSIKKRYFDWKNSQYKKSPGEFKDFADQVLVKKGVLIKTEADCLNGYKGNRHKLLYSWSIVAMKRIMQSPPDKGGEKGNPMLNTEFEQTALMSNLKKEIVGIRQAVGTIDNSLLFPIPFQYYHIVNVCLMILLNLLAYAFLFINSGKGSVFSLIAYPLLCFVLLGLLEVANAMSDPFGSDACGFNQDAIMDGIYNETKRLCEAEEESFLSQLGNPAFNPTRNPDGSLADTPPSEEDLVDNEPKIPDSEVQAIMQERDRLKEEFGKQGIKLVTEQVGRLATAQKTVLEIIKKLDTVPKQLGETNQGALERTIRLEQLLTNQLTALKGELRGDPYETRYMGSQGQAQPSMSPAPPVERRRSVINPPLPTRMRG